MMVGRPESYFLIRDPIATLNSWINAPKEFDPNWSISRELFWAIKMGAYRKFLWL